MSFPRHSVQPPPTMVMLDYYVATHEICSCWRSHRCSHRLRRQLSQNPAPSSACPKWRNPDWGGDATASADPIAASLPGWLADPVPGREWTASPCPSRALSPVVRLQLLFPSSFTHDWETMKEPAHSLYRATSLPLMVEPFWALSPVWDMAAP